MSVAIPQPEQLFDCGFVHCIKSDINISIVNNTKGDTPIETICSGMDFSRIVWF
jgi:hypothetical protein